MTKEQFLSIVDDIEDKFIEEIADVPEQPQVIYQHKEHFSICRILVSAAAVCAVSVGILAAVKLNGTRVVTPNDSLISGNSSETESSSSQGTVSGSIQSTSSISGEEPHNQGAYYDDMFKEIIEENPSSGAPMTYDDVMNVMTNPDNGGLDSYYLVEAIELVKLSDCEKLRGFEEWYYKLNGIEYDGIHYGLNVIYKVKAIKDLITGEDCNKEMYVALSSCEPIYQKAGDPPYAPGEKFTVALFNKAENSDITQSGAGYFFRFDIQENSDGLTALVRNNNSEICTNEVVEVTKSPKNVITSTTENPVQYIAEFELSDLVEFLRKDWKERKLGHFENITVYTDAVVKNDDKQYATVEIECRSVTSLAVYREGETRECIGRLSGIEDGAQTLQIDYNKKAEIGEKFVLCAWGEKGAEIRVKWLP